MIGFILALMLGSLMLGCAIGVFLMCLVSINRGCEHDGQTD